MESPEPGSPEATPKPTGLLSGAAAPKAPADPAAVKPEAKWHWADGVPGEGEPPDWLKGDKYKSVEAQAKAYAGLEKKLGSAPTEPYTLNLPQDIVEAGGAIDENSPLVKDFLDFAKEARLPQKEVDKLIGLYARSQMAAETQDVTALLEELGEPGRKVAAQLHEWSLSTLEPEQQAWLDSALSTAEDIYAFSGILQRLGMSGTREKQSENGAGVSELERLNNEVQSDMSDPRYRTDKAFEQSVRAKFDRITELEGKK